MQHPDAPSRGPASGSTLLAYERPAPKPHRRVPQACGSPTSKAAASPQARRPQRTTPAASASDLDGLWKAYWAGGKQAGSPEEIRLVKHYLPFVAQVADRAHQKNYTSDKNDILQDAYAGLLEAVRKWDPAQGREFRRYAPTLIGHRIIDAVRRGSHLPRRRYDRMKQVQQAVAELSQRKGTGTPSDEAVAATTGLTTEQVRQAYDDADNRRVMSLDHLPSVEVHDRVVSAESDAIDAADDAALHSQMFESIKSLNDRQKQVLALYYYENLTLQEIAAVFGVHHTRIHQILTRAHFIVRSQMQSNQDE